MSLPRVHAEELDNQISNQNFTFTVDVAAKSLFYGLCPFTMLPVLWPITPFIKEKMSFGKGPHYITRQQKRPIRFSREQLSFLKVEIGD